MDRILLHPEWKDLYEQARQWDYGHEITHDEMSALLGIKRGTTRYYSAVGRSGINTMEGRGENRTREHRSGIVLKKTPPLPRACNGEKT